MKESGIAVAFDKLGAIITELERDINYERYRSEDLEKQNAELSKDNALLRAENELLHKQLEEMKIEMAEMRCCNG